VPSPTVFTAIDLEMNQPSGTIIQIGIAVGDITTGTILESASVVINPHETLSEFIINLTGITQAQVDGGEDLVSGYNKICAIHKRHNAFMNPITWGGGDSAELKEQLTRAGFAEGRWVFGRRWIDAKTVYISTRIANRESIQSGLSKSMTNVGLNFKGRKHDAKSDAENTFYMYARLLEIIYTGRRTKK